MLGLLGAKKFSNDDLIKELLSPTLNLENLNKIKEKSKIDLNSLYLNSVKKIYTTLVYGYLKIKLI